MTMLSGIFGNNKNKKTPLISPDEARILKQSELLEDLRALLRSHAYEEDAPALKEEHSRALRYHFKKILKVADALENTDNLYSNGENDNKLTLYTGYQRNFSSLEESREKKPVGITRIFVTPDDLDKSRIDASLKTLSENFDVQFPKFISSFDELMQLAQDKAAEYEEAHDFSTKLMTRIME